jgi:hypothetical protein
MTDITNPEINAIVAAEAAAAEPAKAATMPLVMPLTRAQQESVQAELDKQSKPKTETKDKPRVRAGGMGQPAPTPKPKPAGTNQPDALLVDIPCWPRKHDSPSELAFGKWIKALPMVSSSAVVNTVPLSLGSWAWEVPGDGWEEVMFSCHIDTGGRLGILPEPGSQEASCPHLQSSRWTPTTCGRPRC